MKYLFGVMALVSSACVVAGDEGKDYVYHEGYTAFQRQMVDELKSFHPVLYRMCRGDIENKSELAYAKFNCDKAVKAVQLLRTFKSTKEPHFYFNNEQRFALSCDIARAVRDYSDAEVERQKTYDLGTRVYEHFTPESQTKDSKS